MAEKVVEKLGLQKSLELQSGPLMSPWERFERRFLGRVPAMPVDSAGIPLSPAAAAVPVAAARGASDGQPALSLCTSTPTDSGLPGMP